MQHAVFYSWQHLFAHHSAFSDFLDFRAFSANSFSSASGKKLAALDWSCRRFWCTFQVHHAAFLCGAFSASFALPENPQGNFESMALCRRNGLTGNFYSGNYLEC